MPRAPIRKFRSGEAEVDDLGLTNARGTVTAHHSVPPYAGVPAFALNRRQLIRGLAFGGICVPILLENLVRAEDISPFQDAPDEELAWVCPMHPNYTTTAKGVCPRCGMALIQTRPYDTRDFQLVFRTEPAEVHAGEKVTLFCTFLRPGTGEVVKDFEIVHTKLFHLFVVSQDMEFFEHIHPVMREDGTWTIETTLPKPGYYKVLCDFMPQGGSGQFLAAPLVTADYTGDMEADSAHLEPDRVLKKTMGDMTVSISYDPPQPTSYEYVHLNYYLTDTKTGRPIVDLQTYLGAFGHVLMMSEDMEFYVHSHPINFLREPEDPAEIPEYIIPPDADLAAIRGGPHVVFDALMPKPGLFRAWVQFQRNDQVRTIPFTLKVGQGTAAPVLSPVL